MHSPNHAGNAVLFFGLPLVRKGRKTFYAETPSPNFCLASMNLSVTTSQRSCRSRSPFSRAWMAVVPSEGGCQHMNRRVSPERMRGVVDSPKVWILTFILASEGWGMA